jgi:hypothetical protein
VHGLKGWEEAEIGAALGAAGFAIMSVRPGQSVRVGDFRTLVARKA